jgi:hypothetical protein
LLAVTAVAYYPAWHGTMLWDDDFHITPAVLRPLGGLAAIWFHIGATPQYYPVVHTAFWLQYHAWGLNPLGYHAVNIILHATSAFLLGLVLRRLQIPGAALAAVVFALRVIRFGGHLPKGGYDVSHGERCARPARPAAVL